MTINSNNTTAACSGGELAACPFCGNHLQAKRGNINPYARCVTPDCFGAKMPVVSLDVASDIEKWNTRATQASAPRSASAGGDPSRDDLIESIQFAIGDLSSFMDEYHDFDYQPHQVPPELQALRNLQHHLEGSLISATGETAALASNPLEGKGIQSITEQASSGLRSTEQREG